MKQLAVAILLLTLIDGANLPAEERLDSSSPRPVQKTRAGGLGPAESLASLRVADDLAIDQVLTEPTVRQPVFLNFDERGRMWVVQYAQYPHPAGLKIVSRDNFWRNVYDTVPPPPPHTADSPFRGADKITIHEDTNGDGTFDRHKTFLEGLNMCTSVARGRGGAWVLNPPYLLFYPDRDNDDVPDDDPVVHLKGFGLEDSHSIANSLMWGPDGWLYGAQGSTVTGNVVRPDIDGDKPIYSQGQLIWRYHPETRGYEIFAEGGGNAFGCEIDSKGRVFSGHNGGETRGYHYVQGGYLRKGFEKHGALSNPSLQAIPGFALWTSSWGPTAPFTLPTGTTARSTITAITRAKSTRRTDAFTDCVLRPTARHLHLISPANHRSSWSSYSSTTTGGTGRQLYD
ncbi:MAG: PVC-type heme-binding CxxCH protein [Pirellulales bacterium]